MSNRLMIYGATGYTGTLMSEQAQKLGLDFIVAGRDPAKVNVLAKRLGVEGRSFSVDDASALSKNLDGVSCVLHSAGPFGQTARQMMEACIDRKAHYLDITGEFKVFALAEALSDKAATAGVMLMPGAGWDVVPSDCLAVHTARRAKSAQKLRLFLQHAGPVSRGSASSGGEIFGIGGRVRKNGEVVETNEQTPQMIDFGKGPEHCIPLPMGDVITAWKSARIPNIEVYFQVPKDAAAVDLATMPDGPTAAERAAGRNKLRAEITDADGQTYVSMMETSSGYAYTQEIAPEIARRILSGNAKAGFQSPASAYGESLALSVGAAKFTDL